MNAMPDPFTPPVENLPKGIQLYTVWPPSRFLAYNANPLDLLLGDGYIARGEWTTLVGIGGLGKTRLALWLCIAIITSRKWCDLPTNGGPIKCLFFSTESGLRRIKKDLTMIFAVLTESERGLVEANLRLLAMTPDENGDINLGDLENQARMEATLLAEQPGFIVLDPFADMIDGDENKNSDVKKTMKAVKRIQRRAVPNAAGLILHHARTGANNIKQAGDNYNAGNFGRGGKALYSEVRCELQLSPGHGKDANLLVLACGKANDVEKFKPRGIVFDPQTFTYTVDPAFDYDAWQDDVAGKRTGKTVSIADVVESTRELLKYSGDAVSAKALVDHVVETTGATGIRTIKKRIGEALDDKYLRQPKRGFYALGSKSINQ